MDRRQFLHGGLTAAIGGAFLAERAFSQAPAAPPQGPAAAPAAPAQVPITKQLIIDAHSRSLQWMRTPDEVAAAVYELACGGLCLSVQPSPAHVDPANVRTALPAFVNRVKGAGVRVAQINGPDITDPDDPMVETIVGTAAQAGVTHYSLGTLTYQPGTPMFAQLDALKPRIQKFVRLNEKHRMKLMFDTRPTKNAIGAVVWDLLYVMKEFDPRYVGLHWDTGHMALHGDGMWETLMRTAGPYLAGVGWRDREWQQDIGLKGEGGPYQAPPPRAGGAGAAGGGRAGGGGAAAGRAGGEAAPAGRAGGGAAAAGGAAPAGRAGGGGAAAGAGEEGRAAGARAGGAGGRGRGSGEMPKTPLGGLVGRGNGWSAPMVAMGTGIVDITRVAAILHEIGFDGPSDLRSEYATLGGAQAGADKIQLPRQFVIGLLKRDVITIRKAFEMANTGLAI